MDFIPEEPVHVFRQGEQIDTLFLPNPTEGAEVEESGERVTIRFDKEIGYWIELVSGQGESKT